MLELRIAGPARVVGIDPCPPIEEGLGRVVTGSFHSQSGEVLLLKLQGMEAPIEITSNHPIYSEDRLSFTSVKRLAVGERVRALDGVAIVEALSRKYGSYEVFNLEIEKAHRYYVSEKLVLVHNAGDCGISPAESAWEDEGRAETRTGGRTLFRDSGRAERRARKKFHYGAKGKNLSEEHG